MPQNPNANPSPNPNPNPNPKSNPNLRGEVVVAARRPRVAAEHDGLLHAELARSLAAVVVVVAL